MIRSHELRRDATDFAADIVGRQRRRFPNRAVLARGSYSISRSLSKPYANLSNAGNRVPTDLHAPTSKLRISSQP